MSNEDQVNHNPPPVAPHGEKHPYHANHDPNKNPNANADEHAGSDPYERQQHHDQHASGSTPQP